tara:strand:+ start:462 stop:920 length:459 start_codon:yes stop_codon:yes gene_type:complete
MEFQNTIAYLQTYNAGGVVVPTTSFLSIGYGSTGVDGLIKNFKTNDGKQSFQVQQTGTYFVDFSLVAIGGDGKNYQISPFVNDIQNLDNTIVQFFQQQTTQQYEVSFNQTFSLNRGDILDFKIKVISSASATLFQLKDLKIMAYNLNQLGIH